MLIYHTGRGRLGNPAIRFGGMTLVTVTSHARTTVFESWTKTPSIWWHGSTTVPQPSVGLSLHDAIGWLSLQPMSEVQHRQPLIAWTPWVVVLFTSVAVLPIVVGLLATIRLHHASMPISDHDAVKLHSETIDGAALNIDFRCSGSVSAPCVTLYGGRTIYLPVDWADWSDAVLLAL